MKKESTSSLGLRLLGGFVLMGVVFITDFTVNTALADQKATETPMEISDGYVPNNFTRESDVFVIASGVYPNGCYRWSRAEVIHNDNYEHVIRVFGKVQQPPCVMQIIPFNKEILLGKLVPGNHLIRFESPDGTGIERTLEIE